MRIWTNHNYLLRSLDGHFCPELVIISPILWLYRIKNWSWIRFNVRGFIDMKFVLFVFGVASAQNNLLWEDSPGGIGNSIFRIKNFYLWADFKLFFPIKNNSGTFLNLYLAFSSRIPNYLPLDLNFKKSFLGFSSNFWDFFLSFVKIYIFGYFFIFWMFLSFSIAWDFF